MNVDGLLDPISDDDVEWLRPTFGTIRDDDAATASAIWLHDFAESAHIVWPASVNGRLVVPPPAHILDALVRKSLDLEDDSTWHAELIRRPQPMTVAICEELPRCSICNNEARYDAPIASGPAAQKGDLCPWCYRRRSTNELGASHGQFRMRYSEVFDDVWRAYAEAMSVWRSRGVAIAGDAERECHPDDRANLGWPFETPFVASSLGRHEQAMSEVLQRAEVHPSPPGWIFADLVSVDDGTLTYYSKPHPLDQYLQKIRFSPAARDALDDLVSSLSSLDGVRTRADDETVLNLVIRELAKVLLEGARPQKVLGRLESSLKGRLGPCLWVAPIGGLEVCDHRIAESGLLLGRLDADLHAAINELGREHGITHTLNFDSASRWSEDYEGYLEDPESVESEDDLWRPAVLAQLVEASGSVALHLGFQKARAVCGAAWLAQQIAVSAAGGLVDRRRTPPWILGDRGFPYEPGDPEDLDRHLVSTVGKDGSEHHRLQGWTEEPLVLANLLSGAGAPFLRAVLQWQPGVTDPSAFDVRLACAARHALAAHRAEDVHFEALHVAAALETLVVDDDGPAIAESFARRTSQVVALTSGADNDADGMMSAMKSLYDLRSRAVHRGLSPQAIADSAALVRASWLILPTVLTWAAAQHEAGIAVQNAVADLDAQAR